MRCCILLRGGFAWSRRRSRRAFTRRFLVDAERAMAQGNPGNDILHAAPGLDEVFADPAIVGALSSILGDSYQMHCHRHCHLNRAGSEGRRFHQDGSPRRFQGWSRPWRRHHRPRTVMAIYYPHETPIAMGPTGVIPGTQYCGAQLENAFAYEFRFAVQNRAMCCSCILICGIECPIMSVIATDI